MFKKLAELFLDFLTIVSFLAIFLLIPIAVYTNGGNDVDAINSFISLIVFVVSFKILCKLPPTNKVSKFFCSVNTKVLSLNNKATKIGIRKSTILAVIFGTIGVLVAAGTISDWRHHSQVYSQAYKKCGGPPVLIHNEYPDFFDSTKITPHAVAPDNPSYTKYSHYNPFSSLIGNKHVDSAVCTLDQAVIDNGAVDDTGSYSGPEILSKKQAKLKNFESKNLGFYETSALEGFKLDKSSIDIDGYSYEFKAISGQDIFYSVNCVPVGVNGAITWKTVLVSSIASGVLYGANSYTSPDPQPNPYHIEYYYERDKTVCTISGLYPVVGYSKDIEETTGGVENLPNSQAVKIAATFVEIPSDKLLVAEPGFLQGF